MFKLSDSSDHTSLEASTTPVLRVERRRFLQWLSAPAILSLLPSPIWAAGLRIAAARVWPSNEYTRITLEATAPIRHHLRLLKNPDRLVIDLEGVTFGPELQKLARKTEALSDKYLQGMRFGAPEHNKLRMVLDMKEPVQPQVFTLAPIADYQYRLVIDLYPLQPYDPLLTLLEKEALESGAETRPTKSNPSLTPSLPSDTTASSSDPIGSLLEKQGYNASNPPSPANHASTNLKPRLPDNPLQTYNEKSNTSALGLRKNSGTLIVAIDPGHGGEDPGAIGQQGTYEKNIVLSVGQRLRHVLDNRPNVRTLMTRDADYFVPLNQRVQKARRAKADIFVSIHADGFNKPSARGSSVFVLSEHGASSAAAKLLAQKENASDLIGGFKPGGIQDSSVARLLIDMSQTATINESLKLAQAVLKEMGEINTLHKSAVEQAGFAVLKAPDIPSILVETAFISNPEEEQKLRNEDHQDKIAQAITDGIFSFLQKRPRSS